MTDETNMIYVVTMGTISHDYYGNDSVVATKLGEIDQAPSLEKYMHSLGLEFTRSIHDNCRLLASHTGTEVTHVIIKRKTRLKESDTFYKPETLWVGEPTKQFKELVEDSDVTDGATELRSTLTMLALGILAILLLLVLASLIG